MKVIGGFFELQLPKKSFDYHHGALALSTGRACLGVMLQNLNIAKCYLPNYTCDAVYHPFDLYCTNYELYNIDEKMEPINLPDLKENEFFFYINYFGVKNDVIEKLYRKYGNRLIIDNTHDFFKKSQFDCWSFTSARKYFGVPDGAFLYSPLKLENHFKRFNHFSLTHSIERLRGNQNFAFENYQNYEKSLTCEINKISSLSEKLLSTVDIKEVIRKRKENFKVLNSILNKYNKFNYENLGENDTPFAYPFLPEQHFPKEQLYSSNVFIPTLWNDALKREFSSKFERKLANDLMPLPIDERYDENDMEFVAEKIIKIVENA